MNKYESALIEITGWTLRVGGILVVSSIIIRILGAVIKSDVAIGIGNVSLIIGLTLAVIAIFVYCPWIISTAIFMIFSVALWPSQYNQMDLKELIFPGISALLMILSIFKAIKSPLNPILYK